MFSAALARLEVSRQRMNHVERASTDHWDVKSARKVLVGIARIMQHLEAFN